MERAATLAKEEAYEQYRGDVDLDDWIDTLTEFDERAGIDGVGDDFHQDFMTEYLAEEGLPSHSPSGGTELIDFYTEYAAYLRNQDVSLSKEDEAEVTNHMIFDEHRPVNGEEETIDVDALQIEAQIVAIYW